MGTLGLSRPGVPGRRSRQVHIAERNPAQEQAGQDQIGPELAGIVSRLRRAMRRAARAADPALELSVAQLELLSCITEHQGIRPSQLARVNEDIIQAALVALPHRDQAALRDAAPALRDLAASVDAQAD